MPLSELIDAVVHGEQSPTDTPSEEPHVSPSKPPASVGHEQEPRRSTFKSHNSANTPSARTGPPRSLSYPYSLPSSPRTRDNSKHETDQDIIEANPDDTLDFTPRGSADFRSPFEYPEQTDTKKGKKRESRVLPNLEEWNPIKWFQDIQDSPKEEKSDYFEPREPKSGHASEAETTRPSKRVTLDTDNAEPSENNLRRAYSDSHSPPEKNKAGRAKWGRLRSLLPKVVNENAHPAHSVVTHHTVNITDELIAGGLSTMMLHMWFERDEKDERRVPVLLHRLRIRVSDSLHPLQGHKAVFRIECEYANGAARWVVYRQLRDFISLHSHYTLSNAYYNNVKNLPEFPRTSLPYFKFLNKDKGNVGQAEFARMQRESLENYLLELIRAVMFHPAANRLAGFLEMGALSISLAQSGGAQYKAGFLQIEASRHKGGGFGRKSLSWKEKKESRWCAVRESYLVVLEEMGELTVWDVFMLDSDFKIERPKRYYRQGLNLLHGDESDNEKKDRKQARAAQNGDHLQVGHAHSDGASFMGSVRSRLSKVLHIGHHHKGSRSHNGTAVTGDASSVSSSSSSESSMPSRAPTPMLDPSTNTNPLVEATGDTHDGEPQQLVGDAARKKKRKAYDVSKHTFYIENSQMRLKLTARNERQMLQWITALEKIAATSHWTGTNRFDSFAPIRLNVAAQWLVDGRDYFWNLSRALLLARETIYIHDWWLSPELQMRRPNKDRYRLDRLLERKAKEGVKIYIILYQEVSNRTTPTDSNYTKQRLTALHPNIMVQRSPSHFQTGTFYWAHHEKMCVIDQAIAFMGGIDMCFGRWDTAQHVIIDEGDAGVDQEQSQSQIWPGKDYSNPRISDFHTLNKPDEDMYDRTRIARMPWHDVGLQVVGQPARDIARHFVQRWNYLLRIKNHSRLMPFLLPPPEFKPGELTQMGLTGTCEMQICRSAGPWSLGTPTRIEHSIQNAYLKAIQMSEHFVYIENQFFITSTVVNDIKIENKIGDALVHRIIRAHREGTPWKCCILLPVFPGFSFPVDHSDASAVRIILECQNRTIARGPNSIYGRLRKENIDPDDYISVFALRNWGKLPGGALTTEQIYIHGKICIVDDRLAIIGSANINERSQRGDRDSELAAIIRDTDMIDCTMAGKPFKVGRFAHSLRVRLMREHLGIDVDAMDAEDLMANDPVKEDFEQDAWDPDAEQQRGQTEGVSRVKKSDQRTAVGEVFKTGLDSASQAVHGLGETASHNIGKTLDKAGFNPHKVDETVGEQGIETERTTYTRDGKQEPGFASSVVPTLEEQVVSEARPPQSQANGTPIAEKLNDHKETRHERRNSDHNAESERSDAKPEPAHTDDGELFGAPADASTSPKIDDQPPHSRSGIDDADEQEKAAPDARSTIRRQLGSRLDNKTWTVLTPAPKIDPDGLEDPVADSFWKNVWVAAAVHNTEIYRKVFHAIPDDLVTTWKQYKEFIVHHERLNKHPRDSTAPEAVGRMASEAGDEDVPGKEQESVPPLENPDAKADDPSLNRESPEDKDAKARKPARGVEPFEKWERDQMEALLGELTGHLVIYPTRFLEGEDVANNFVFNADRMLPLPIYD